MKLRTEAELKTLMCPFFKTTCLGTKCAAFDIRDDVVRAKDIKYLKSERPILGMCLLIENENNYAGM